MKFKISRVWYQNYDEILNKYPKLKEFDITKSDEECMYINLESIEDLMRLVEKLEHQIVISESDDAIFGESDIPSLMIYDGYME
jgi:hypothetical protein